MDRFCKLFVDADCEKNELVSHLAAMTNGTVEQSTVATTWGEFNVVRNKAIDDACEALEQDRFLYFRYFLEIEPLDNIEDSDYIRGVGSLLRTLWSSGIDAVAACSFEDELPSRGGYDPKR